MMKNGIFLLFCIMLFLYSSCQGQSLEIVKSGNSSYVIVIPDVPSSMEKKAAELLQTNISRSSKVSLPVVKEKELQSEYAIFIGKCITTKENVVFDKDVKEGFAILQNSNNLFIKGYNEQGTLYAVSHFLEKYLGCRKYDTGPPVVPLRDELRLPANLTERVVPDFDFRQSYYPLSNDVAYLEWHGLQKFEDLWGLWGHSFFKLVPPSEYFMVHPEYYALVGGKRRTSQLCLSNDAVLRIVIERLKLMMNDNPDAIYWSVSPNDEGGYCTCERCGQIDKNEGGPSGSLIHFVNKVAAVFPDKKITTLGYGYTASAPSKTKPANNVFILVSSIDVFKQGPVTNMSSAVAFRKQLEDWTATTSNIFVWDYCTQFTNYLAPFPVQHIFQPDFLFYKSKKVKGIFEQGSGDTYGDMAELNSYIQAKLLWNTNQDVALLTKDFCNGYYGKAAPYIMEYLESRTKALLDSGKNLDIYGSPILDIRGYLSPKYIDIYDQLLEKAQLAVAGTIYEERVRRVRLSLDYTVLQQSRHFGVDKYGFLEDNGSVVYAVNAKWKKKVSMFAELATTSGVIELSEEGLSPQAYQQEWNIILNKQWRANPVRGAAVTYKTAFSEDYPAKGKNTLTDGMTGFNDFSYNWLCFYGQNMELVIDAGKVIDVGKVTMDFLEDQRHWIFPPVAVSIEISSDGTHYTVFKQIQTSPLFEKNKIEKVNVSASGPAQKARYFKITAVCPQALPEWRAHPVKKPMIACDEIFVFP